MTKQEAYEAILNGKVIRHYNYSPDEYTYMNTKTGIIMTEEGYCHGDKYGEFWSDYQKWEDGWELVDMEHPLNQNESMVFNENEPYELINPYHLDELPSKPLKRGYYASVRTEPKIQRNEPCPCGSGKKYKKCCM